MPRLCIGPRHRVRMQSELYFFYRGPHLPGTGIGSYTTNTGTESREGQRLNSRGNLFAPQWSGMKNTMLHQEQSSTSCEIRINRIVQNHRNSHSWRCNDVRDPQ